MHFTAGQIAHFLEGKVEGEVEAVLSSFGKIEEAQAGDLTFLANKKYEPFIYSTQATAVLVESDFTPREPVASTLIRVKDPYDALASLMKLVQKQKESNLTGIDPTAKIDPSVNVPDDCYIGAYVCIEQGVRIGSGCRVFPYTYIGTNCIVGDNSVLYPRVTLYSETIIGCCCILHSGCVIGADGFGFAPTKNGYNKIPQIGHVELADYVEVGANTCIDRAVMGVTFVGEGTKLDNLIQVGHNCTIGKHNVMAAQVGIAGSTKVGDFCQFAGQVGLPGHITIGDKVRLGGQAGVIGNVPSGSTMLGTPAINYTKALRSFVVVEQLPELVHRINQLEKELSTLKAK